MNNDDLDRAYRIVEGPVRYVQWHHGEVEGFNLLPHIEDHAIFPGDQTCPHCGFYLRDHMWLDDRIVCFGDYLVHHNGHDFVVKPDFFEVFVRVTGEELRHEPQAKSLRPVC